MRFFIPFKHIFKKGFGQFGHFSLNQTCLKLTVLHLPGKSCSCTTCLQFWMKSLQNNSMWACSVPLQVASLLQGHRISAGRAAGPGASAGIRFHRLMHKRWQCRENAEQGSAAGEMMGRCCLRSNWLGPGTSLASSWSWTSVWTGYGTEPAGGPAATTDTSNVSGFWNPDTHPQTHQRSNVTGVRPQTLQHTLTF